MDCQQHTWITNKTFIQRFNRNVIKNRVPLSGGINLTNSCNMKCIHCYVPLSERKGKTSKQELNTIEVKKIIDEVATAGCLNFLFTGGEPLLREDFSELYIYARKKGLLVTVFTNGTLISDDVVKLFKLYPPNAVEISLYGATSAVYESITGVPGSYDKCMKGIKLLVDSGIRCKLKTVLMNVNQNELFEMKNFAEKLGVPFRFDGSLFSEFDGGNEPLKYRVLPEEIVDFEFTSEDVKSEWREFWEISKDSPLSDSLYFCGAGVAMFHITADGMLQPCLMPSDVKYNLLEGTFSDGWENELPKLREKKQINATCLKCGKKSLCGYCPPFLALEMKNDQNSDFLCQLGSARYKRMM